MTTILLEPTATAQWHTLVREAARVCDGDLDEELESYLVFLLMRFAQRPEMARSVLALDYLRGLQQPRQREQLQDVGDQCLLYSGLFPLRARRRRVALSYYVDLGRAAYLQLGENLERSWGQLFEHLSEAFVRLRDVLQATRALNTPETLDPLALHELWAECGSRRAADALSARTGAALVRGGRTRH